MARNFPKELRQASEIQDWAAHERIWEERRCAEVNYDEDVIQKDLERAREIVASNPRNAEFEDWCRSVRNGEHDDHHEVLKVLGDLSEI